MWLAAPLGPIEQEENFEEEAVATAAREEGNKKKGKSGCWPLLSG